MFTCRLFRRFGYKEMTEKHIASDSDDESFKAPAVAPDAKEQLPSLFGETSEEEPTPFFLEDAGSVQYIYRPTQPLVFGAGADFVDIYRHEKLRSKLRYCKNAGWLLLLAGAVLAQPQLYSIYTMGVFCALPSLVVSRGLNVQAIQLHKDGETLKIQYKRNKLSRVKDYICKIEAIPEPKGDRIPFWNVYEFPDDLRTFIERDKMQELTWAKKYGAWWTFFVLQAQPSFVNREVLVNALNRIQIDTQEYLEGEIKERYFIKDSPAGSEGGDTDAADSNTK